MQLTLTDSSTVTLNFDSAGNVKSASKMLGNTTADGYAVVTFLTPTVAQEFCVSPAQGFSSVRVYENNQPLRESCTDLWHKKAFYYTYDSNGNVAETQIRSLGTATKEQKGQRPPITHCPHSLLTALAGEPNIIFAGTDRWTPTIHNAFDRSRTAA